MKKSLRRKISSIVLISMLVINVVSILMNYLNFISSQEKFSYSTASTVAETCSLIIDNDSLTKYIRSGCRDTDYYVTWNKLIDYRNTNEDIVELSVVNFKEDGCHYIFDTDLSENGAFLGDMKEFDARQNRIRKKLIEGDIVDSIVYTDKIDVYRPLHSSFNIPLGYVVVGISTAQAAREQHIYLLRMSLVMLFLGVVVVIYMLLFLSRNVVNPINQLAEATAGYAESVKEDDAFSKLSRLSIKTGDEIEHLCYSVQKMERDLLSSSNNLSIAMWNSNHDSMTQLYNKRYLKEYTENHADYEKVAAIYFDVDNLKKMNDICGHEAGDEVIKKTADFIRNHELEHSFSVRMGGDEFLMLLFDYSEEEIAKMVREMKADPGTKLTEPDQEVQCRIAIGYAFDDQKQELEEVIQNADKEMYKDKQSHR